MTCRIILDNPGAYKPGDTVHGRVALSFTSSVNFRAVRCKFRGREHTAWTERESYYDSSSKSTKYRTVHYSGDHKFLLVNIDLVGEGTLRAGHYTYPFSFTFPKHNIPNPYNGNYGYIRYYIKAYVDIPFGFDYEDEITLHLISPINFNDIRSQLQLNPVCYQDEKTLCCFCCASDPITMDLILEKEAFVIGETAKIKAEVTNMSNTSITDLELKIKMTIESKTTSPSTKHKYDTELVAFANLSGVGAHGARTYKFDLLIPASTVVPNFAGCTLFKQWCVLKAEATIPGCHTNLSVETGVKLGHIPLLQTNASPTFVPASQAPGGAFPLPPPYIPVPDTVPPYPTGPPAYPSPTGKEKDIDGPSQPLLSGEGPSSSSASAPYEVDSPSAPSKAELAQQDEFELLDDPNKDEVPPPSYNDYMKSSENTDTKPSAPPK